MGHPSGWGEESGRAAHDAHLSDDEAVAKMGHPAFVLSPKVEGFLRRFFVVRIWVGLPEVFEGFG